jgi:hypothetical protein
VTTPRILIATPTDGRPDSAHVTWAYHQAVRNLERSGCVSLPATIGFSDDLAKARSRLARVALERDGWDAVLWLDDDVAPQDVSIIGRMASSGHDVIGAPYPRKRIPALIPYKPLASTLETGRLSVEGDCTEVELLAFGCMLTSRRCLESMVAAYREGDWFSDSHDGIVARETVAIFGQVQTPTREVDGHRHRDLLGEDYSFCYRWRAIGGRVMMYVGAGAPVRHIGGHEFTATRAEIGNV